MTLIVGLVISLLLFIICFICLGNPLFSMLPFVLCIIYFVLVANKKMNSYLKKVRNFQICHQFINSFIISISIQPILDQAFINSYDTFDKKFKERIEGIEGLTINEKLRYLSNYFPFNIYSIFIQIVELWEEQGGDILSMSSFLLNQMRLTEDYVTNCKRLNDKKIVEYGILWFLSLSVLVVIRFALSQFYVHLKTTPIFMIGVMCLLLFALVSIHLFISKITAVDIKGWNNNVSKR